MSLHFQRQVNTLKKVILGLGTLVEEKVADAIRAIESRDTALANRVIESDDEVDKMELEVEEECLHTLALHQPVAFDLRYVIAVLKINNDLERIGDLAVNIAEQAVFLANEMPLDDIPFDLPGMAGTVRRMLKQSLDALINIDPELAQRVRESDDQVDAIHREMYQAIESGMRENPHRIEQYIHLLNVSRQLERIADHSVNIAEDVIYMAKGEVLRHSRPHPLANRASRT
jgi:phosphate transport system protein